MPDSNPVPQKSGTLYQRATASPVQYFITENYVHKFQSQCTELDNGKRWAQDPVSIYSTYNGKRLAPVPGSVYFTWWSKVQGLIHLTS